MSAGGQVMAIPRALRAQYASREERDRGLTAGISAMLAAARRDVAAYAGSVYDIGPIRDLSDVATLPLLTKADVLRVGAERFHSPVFSAAECHLGRTSGTSSRVLEVRHDLSGSWAHDRAANVRRFLATGRYQPWHRLVHFKEGVVPSAWHERFGLFRRDQVLIGWAAAERVRALLSAPVQAIIGYPVLLRDLLRGLSPAELAELRQSLRVVFTESELLGPDVREQLVEGFGVPVFDEYSAEEALHIAYQCAEGQLHVAEDRVYVEVVDEAGAPVPDGVEGGVVVTAFRERAMPLVRYVLGDRAVRRGGRCACGRTFRRLELTQGRADDYVVLPDGERLYVGPFLAMATRTPGVAECMVRQDDTGRITVHLVPEGGGVAFADVADGARRCLADLVGRTLPVHFAVAEAVETTARGKGRFMESRYRPS